MEERAERVARLEDGEMCCGMLLSGMTWLLHIYTHNSFYIHKTFMRSNQLKIPTWTGEATGFPPQLRYSVYAVNVR